MSTQIATSELAEFHQFISQKIAEKQTELTPEEVLELWREKRPSAEDYSSTVTALREAIQDIENGDQGRPANEFDREFRDRNRIA